jgi:hypothetical protein
MHVHQRLMQRSACPAQASREWCGTLKVAVPKELQILGLQDEADDKSPDL